MNYDPMKRPTAVELEIIGKAGLERLGEQGVVLFDAVLDLAEKQGWSLWELAAHLEGAADMVNGLIAGWVDEKRED